MGAETPDVNEERSEGNYEAPPEYHFDEGVRHVTEKIQGLLDSGQKYVCVSGGSLVFPETNVGKTTLSNSIGRYLTENGIPYESFANPRAMREQHLTVFKSYFKEPEKFKGGVILFNASVALQTTLEKIQTVRLREDNSLKQEMAKVGLPIEKIDIRIGLYRPDRPYEKQNGRGENIFPIADIIICNEKAQDKK